VQARWRTASREKLIEELERQEHEKEQLRRERDRYRQERDRLRKKIERLEDDLDEARRALHRQAAPFSRGASRCRPRRPIASQAGRMAGKRIDRSRRRLMNATRRRCRLAAPIAAAA